jgi:hypothetical protein
MKRNLSLYASFTHNDFPRDTDTGYNTVTSEASSRETKPCTKRLRVVREREKEKHETILLLFFRDVLLDFNLGIKVENGGSEDKKLKTKPEQNK